MRKPHLRAIGSSEEGDSVRLRITFVDGRSFVTNNERQRKRAVIINTILLRACFTTVERGTGWVGRDCGTVDFDVAYFEMVGEEGEEFVCCGGESAGGEGESAFVVTVRTECSGPVGWGAVC